MPGSNVFRKRKQSSSAVPESGNPNAAGPGRGRSFSGGPHKTLTPGLVGDLLTKEDPWESRVPCDVADNSDVLARYDNLIGDDGPSNSQVVRP